MASMTLERFFVSTSQPAPQDFEVIELFSVTQLAAFFGQKPKTIYNNITLRPESLPPIFRRPGSDRPLFVNPRQWVTEQIALQIALQQRSAPAETPPVKRGRKSHKEKAQLKIQGVSK